MVSTGVFGGIFFTVVVAVGLPIALLLLLLTTRRKGLLAAIVGAACFVVFALILEQISHAIMLPIVGRSPLWYCVYGCLAAGIFEETGRLVGFSFLCKWRAKKEDSAATALGYGIGHGGIEAILLAGLLSINNLRFAFALQNGSLEDGFLGMSRPVMDAVAEQMQTGTFWDFAPGGVERIFALVAQISLSVLMWLVVTGRTSKLGYPLAILLHAFLNIGAVLGQIGAVTQIWFIELWIGISAGIVCLIVWMLYSRARHREALAQHHKAAQARARKRAMKADASADTAGVAATAALAEQTWQDLEAPEAPQAEVLEKMAATEQPTHPPLEQAAETPAPTQIVEMPEKSALATPMAEAAIPEATDAEIVDTPPTEAPQEETVRNVTFAEVPAAEAKPQAKRGTVDEAASPAEETEAVDEAVSPAKETEAEETAKPAPKSTTSERKPTAQEVPPQAVPEVILEAAPAVEASALVLPAIPLAPPATPRRRVTQATTQDRHKNWRKGKRR